MVVTIEDDDRPAWEVTVSEATIAEADTGSSTVTVSTGGVTFASARTIKLDFNGSTATLTDDYTVGATTLTLNAGESSVETAIAAVNDTVDDDDETIVVSATLDDGGVDVAIGTQRIISITDNDAATGMANSTLTPSPADPTGVTASTAAYTITFEGAWTTAATPGAVPTGAHFSPLIGAVHNGQVTFLQAGGTASAGIESMAQDGGTAALKGEINGNANALRVLERSGDISPTATVTLAATLDTDHPRITLLTMIAPSPDWFVGVSGLSLLDSSGNWVPARKVDLYAWDAGTEEGTEFSLSNAATSPQGAIANLRGTGKFSGSRIATVTFTRATVTETPVVSVAADAAKTTVDIGTASFTLTRTGSTAEVLSVAVGVTEEHDFVAGALPTTVEFAAGESEATLEFPRLWGDAPQAGDLTVTVQEGEGYEVSATAGSAAMEVVVLDAVLTLRLDAAAKTVGEGDGSVTVTVIAQTAEGATAPQAQTGMEGALSLGAASAAAGEDFESFASVVRFAPEDFTLSATVYRAERSTTIGILDDDLVEPPANGAQESFTVELARSPGTRPGVTIPNTVDAPGEMAVTIEDDDKPQWKLAVEPDTIAEAETGASTVTVGTGGKIFAADQAVALLFAGTADETDDYTVADANDQALTAPYELTLAAGETSVTAIVTAVDDEDVDAGETIEITAMHDGAAIGAAQTIAIIDDDEAVSVPDPPTGLEATASGTGTIDLSWTAPAADGGARHYRLPDRVVGGREHGLGGSGRRHRFHRDERRRHHARRRDHAALPGVGHQLRRHGRSVECGERDDGRAGDGHGGVKRVGWRGRRCDVREGDRNQRHRRPAAAPVRDRAAERGRDGGLLRGLRRSRLQRAVRGGGFQSGGHRQRRLALGGDRVARDLHRRGQRRGGLGNVPGDARAQRGLEPGDCAGDARRDHDHHRGQRRGGLDARGRRRDDHGSGRGIHDGDGERRRGDVPGRGDDRARFHGQHGERHG